MEKAFDTADLVKRFKAGGLDIAEEAAKHIAKSVLGWVKDSVLLTPNKYDDFFVAVAPTVEAAVLKQLDRIDGQEG